MKDIISLKKVYPSITSIPEYAHMLAILEANEDNTPWIMENFIVMRGFTPSGAPHIYNIDFFLIPDTWHNTADMTFSAKYNYAPGLSVCSIPNAEYADILISDILEFSQMAINSGCFVVLPLDVSKIKAYQMDDPFLHNPLIYGYKTSTKEFLLSDFVNGKKYDDFVCTYEELVNAFESYRNFSRSANCKEEHWQNQSISLIRPKSVKHSFDIRFFCAQLQDQIVPEYAEQKYKIIERSNTRTLFWGNHSYDGIIRYIETCMTDERICSVKPFHTIFDHKIALQKRIQYLGQHLNLDTNIFNKVLSMSDNLIKSSMQLRNTVLRNEFRMNVAAQNDFIKVVMEIKKQETEMIKWLLSIIQDIEIYNGTSLSYI